MNTEDLRAVIQQAKEELTLYTIGRVLCEELSEGQISILVNSLDHYKSREELNF